MFEIGSSGGVRPEESDRAVQSPDESRRGDLGAVVSHGGEGWDRRPAQYDALTQWELGVTVARWLLEGRIA